MFSGTTGSRTRERLSCPDCGPDHEELKALVPHHWAGPSLTLAAATVAIAQEHGRLRRLPRDHILRCCPHWRFYRALLDLRHWHTERTLVWELYLSRTSDSLLFSILSPKIPQGRRPWPPSVNSEVTCKTDHKYVSSQRCCGDRCGAMLRFWKGDDWGRLSLLVQAISPNHGSTV
ncbi:hypothetical protein M404DRAFT_277597 [Pisolithus tinctorius Marx 270]|uniref:Uncharacterized protein n=1 Tax=Pisolithus tinctorius Marx 270 TaxID=870435 RepID=A0A0C3P835_PISTI|nr:hypothetical protein M404DRAFT_277597 [Pisolithus tinctorius Marx 270]